MVPMGMPGEMLPMGDNFGSIVDPNIGSSSMQTRPGLPNLKGAGDKKVCPFWLSNSCRAAMACPDRHPPEYECEMLRAEYKKKPCRFGAACQNQKFCLYGHDLESMDQAWQVPDRGQDWMCPSCNSQNFARRHTCHKCWEKKPEGAQPVQNSGSKQQSIAYGYSGSNSGNDYN